MTVLEAIGPIALLIALGAGLGRIRFLGAAFSDDLNKLAFWVALPALIFRSAALAVAPAGRALPVLALLVGATLAIAILGLAIAPRLALPRTAWGTFSQAAFRGNLALVGLPVLTFGQGSVGIAIVVLTALMVFYNFLAVLVLQGSRGSLGATARSIAGNPLVIAGIAGLLWAGLKLPLPVVFDRALGALGAAAVPIALLCIGGSLVAGPIRLSPATAAAAALKVLVLPALVFAAAKALALPPDEFRVAVVLAACPTAAASYVMAVRMGGDAVLASSTVALSTLLSAPALALALWLTG